MEPMVHTNDRDEFSSRLKQALQFAGQDGYGVGARLAKKLKVTPKAVSKWMNGETRPGHAKRMELARWLGVREEWLDYGRGPMQIEASRSSSDLYQSADKPSVTGIEESGALPMSPEGIDSLINKATPRSRDALMRISRAAEEGRITEDDLLLLERIADYLEQREGPA